MVEELQPIMAAEIDQMKELKAKETGGRVEDATIFSWDSQRYSGASSPLMAHCIPPPDTRRTRPQEWAPTRAPFTSQQRQQPRYQQVHIGVRVAL